MTGNEDWHGLTFNPARGNPEVVGTLARQITDTGNWLKESYNVLENVKNQKDAWTGAASKAFTDKLGDLPGLLNDAHRSMLGAGKALVGWQSTVTNHHENQSILRTRPGKRWLTPKIATSASSQRSTDVLVCRRGRAA
jgi:hypothetical protein